MPSKRSSRYGRYAGGPDPLAPPVDLSEALDAIGNDVMAGYSPERALRELLRRGSGGREGLDDLTRRINARRRDLLSRYRMDGTLQEVRELLDRAVDAERRQLLRDAMMDDDDRAFRELRLDNLPSSTAAAVNELADYDWASTDARKDYEKIKDLLGRELLDQRFAGMKQALENATDEDRAAINEMLDDLNELLEKHRRGEDTPEEFDEFMAKHGQYFPENPSNVEELIDALAQRAAAAQRLLRSMSAEQREELMRLSSQAFGSPGLMAQLDRLDSSLQALRPGQDWGGGEQFSGGQGSPESAAELLAARPVLARTQCLQVAVQPVECAISPVSRTPARQLHQFLALRGVIERSIRWAAAARCAIASINSSTFRGFSGKTRPCLAMNSSKSSGVSSPRRCFVEQLVEVVEHRVDRGPVPVRRVLHGLLHAGESLVEQFAAEQVLDLVVAFWLRTTPSRSRSVR